jgi:tetratricopeptide (TPR) repeat protein
MTDVARAAEDLAPGAQGAIQSIMASRTVIALETLIADDIRNSPRVSPQQRATIAGEWERQVIDPDPDLEAYLVAWLATEEEKFLVGARTRWTRLFGTSAKSAGLVTIAMESAKQKIKDFRAQGRMAPHATDEMGTLVEFKSRNVNNPTVERADPRRPIAMPVRFNLPAVAASFTGRDKELAALDVALRSRDRAVITQTITGLGGVGKSQLAARYVEQHVDDYDIVAWIHAEDGGIADLADLASKLGLPDAGRSPSQQARFALEWLGESELQWLLVLDNVASPDQLEDLIPSSGHGRVVVTSRDRALRKYGPELAVDVFDEEVASAYLITRVGRPTDEADAEKLATALGGLPLALSHAAAYCVSGTSFADYLDLLEAPPARELRHPEQEQFYERAIASTWKPSIQAVADIAPLAVEVLEMAAHLGPDAIPRLLFRVLGDSDTAGGPQRLTDAFNALERFSLATVDDDSIGVHRLLQKVVREDAIDRRNQTAALRALTALSDTFPHNVRLPASWPLCEQLVSHALALAEAFKHPASAGPELIDLLNRTCDYLYRSAPGQRLLVTAQTTLRHAERTIGAEHPSALTMRAHVATGYLWTGFIDEATALFEPLLADHVRILGPEHHHTLKARYSLALAYKNAGRAKEAIAILEPLLAGRKQMLGNDDPLTLTACHSLATVYNMVARTDEAIALLEPLVADDERILGVEHPNTLTARHSLALAYENARRNEDAIALLEPLLADRKRLLGDNHVDTLRTRHSLAMAQKNATRVTDAIAVFQLLLRDEERILGEDHPETLKTRQSLALAYLDVGRTSEAIDHFTRLLIAREQKLGSKHRATRTTRENLARAFKAAAKAVEVTVTGYTASGGASALLRTAAGWTVRVEAHRGSFALVWPAVVPLTDFVRLLPDSDQDVEVLLGVRGTSLQELLLVDAMEALEGSGSDVDFARFELDRLTMTWTRQRRHVPPGPHEDVVHEIGIGAESFDEILLERLLTSSAVEGIAKDSAALLRCAREVLVDIPTEHL